MYGRGGRGYDDRDMGRDMDMRYNDRRDHRGGRHDYRDDYSRDDYRDRRYYRERDYDRGRGRDRDRYGYGYNSAGFNPGRDPLVDEFRSTFGKSRPWGLRDVQGHVVAFCQDQHGSRFIQQRLEVCNDAEKQLVFEEILPVANPLMIDVFGNYVLQKLFEYGTPEQCEALALLVTGQAVDLSMQMYGCRVVQKAMEYANTQRLLTLVSEFESTPVRFCPLPPPCLALPFLCVAVLLSFSPHLTSFSSPVSPPTSVINRCCCVAYTTATATTSSRRSSKS
jgi:hypothetical protein